MPLLAFSTALQDKWPKICAPELGAYFVFFGTSLRILIYIYLPSKLGKKLIYNAHTAKTNNGKAANLAQSAKKKSVRARGPQNCKPDMFDQTRCLRTFECRICPESQRIGQDRCVREKSVRANGPTKTNKVKGTFSLNNLVVGTVRPPETNVGNSSV